jgi:hypothetical protein
MVMARATPRVAGATLFDPADANQPITVGTPPWYTWLAGATTFAFITTFGRFTARKERRGPADRYWRAYRKHAGVVRSAYIGRTADLTLERLHAVAAMLADPAPTSDTPTQSVADPAAPITDQTADAVSALPTGTVTCLFTDIEGSTQLCEQHPQTMPAALAQHHVLL